jgi:hypothetical protein
MLCKSLQYVLSHKQLKRGSEAYALPSWSHNVRYFWQFNFFNFRTVIWIQVYVNIPSYALNSRHSSLEQVWSIRHNWIYMGGVDILRSCDISYTAVSPDPSAGAILTFSSRVYVLTRKNKYIMILLGGHFLAQIGVALRIISYGGHAGRFMTWPGLKEDLLTVNQAPEFPNPANLLNKHEFQGISSFHAIPGTEIRSVCILSPKPERFVWL